MMNESPRLGTSTPSGPEAVRRIGATPALPGDFQPLRLVLHPGGASTMELMQPDVLLGRHSSADVRLALPDVSRRHCRLVFAAGRWQVIDLNSLNGVYVNNQLVEQSMLESGDLLRIGSFSFVVEIGPVQQEPAENLIFKIFQAMPRRAS